MRDAGFPKPDLKFMAAQLAIRPASSLFEFITISPDFSPNRSNGGCTGPAVYIRGVGTVILIRTSDQKVTVWLVDGSTIPAVERRLVNAQTGRPVSFRSYDNASRELSGLLDTGGLAPCWRWDPPTSPISDWVPRRLASGQQRLGSQAFDWKGASARWTVKAEPWGVDAYRGRKRLRRFSTILEAISFCEHEDRAAAP